MLLKTSSDEFSNIDDTVCISHHELHNHPLFQTDAIIELLSNYPRNMLQAFTMGSDPCNRNDWQSVDTLGSTGQDLFDAVVAGRLWLNVQGVQNADSRYAEIIKLLFDDLHSLVDGFHTQKQTSTLIISSPNALVYYHADAQPNFIWQIKGQKRLWVYPALNDDLVPQELMEDIFANFADEEIPYMTEWDDLASVYELNPGQFMSWPQNAPHRVTNQDCLNISLSTPYETPLSDRRKMTYCANRYFRRHMQLPLKSTKEIGAIPSVKRLAYRVAQKLHAVDIPPRRAYVSNLRVDPASDGGYTLCKDGLRPTEYSSQHFSLVTDANGTQTVKPIV